jgi:glycosyltransferase involved in cell wall biosynthesis
MKNKFIVVVPLYNAKKWIAKSLKSLMLQTYDNFECAVIDDCSTDESYEIAKKITKHDTRFVVTKNDINVGPLANAYNGAMNISSSPEDIVVVLDGDDFLFSKDTLSILNRYYSDKSCWMTYGSYINLSDKKKGKFSQQIPPHIIEGNLYRESQWLSSHLRSYKMFLLQKISTELEMSGYHAKYVKEILYIWNDLNELNEHKTKRKSQLELEKTIREAKRYDKILGDNYEN